MDDSRVESELHRIRAMISTGQFSRARSLLVKLDHPDAHKMLAEIDEIAQHERDEMGRSKMAGVDVGPGLSVSMTTLFLIWGGLMVSITYVDNLWLVLVILVPPGFLGLVLLSIPPVLTVFVFTGLGLFLSLTLPPIWKTSQGQWAILVVVLLNSCGFLCFLLLLMSYID